VRHAPTAPRTDDARTYAQRVRTARNEAELVDAFLTHVREGEGASAREAEIVGELLDERTRVEARA
jgi:exonuclease SbcD